MKKEISRLIEKYQKYIANVDWDTRVNKRSGKEKESNDSRLRDFKEILSDLKSLLP